MRKMAKANSKNKEHLELFPTLLVVAVVVVGVGRYVVAGGF